MLGFYYFFVVVGTGALVVGAIVVGTIVVGRAVVTTFDVVGTGTVVGTVGTVVGPTVDDGAA